jgi:hypothetical protein
MHETHLKQFDVVKKKSFKITDRKLRKKQEKKRKIVPINDCEEYISSIIKKINKFIFRIWLRNKETGE